MSLEDYIPHRLRRGASFEVCYGNFDHRPRVSKRVRGFVLCHPSCFRGRSGFLKMFTGDDAMKQKRTLLVLLIGMCFLSSCASPLKKQLLSNEVPTFGGPITPISIPIQPEYKPSKIKIDSKIALVFDITTYTGSSPKKNYASEEEWSESWTSHATKLGDMLTWDLKMVEYTENFRTTRPNIPLAEIKILTDKRGSIKEHEILLPFFEQPQIRSKMGDKEIENLKKEMKNALDFSPALSQTPVVTGSILYTTNVFEAFKAKTGIDLLSNKEKPNSIVKGWGYFEGRKVIISSMDYVFEISEKDQKFKTLMKGYSLWDADTYMPVKGEVLINIGFYGDRGDLLKLFWKLLKQKGEIPRDSTSTDITLKVIISQSSQFTN